MSVYQIFGILGLNLCIPGIHEPGQKPWGGGGAYGKFDEISQICEYLKGWSKNFQKMPFLAKFSHFWPKIFFRGVKAKDFSGEGYRLSTPPPSCMIPG